MSALPIYDPYEVATKSDIQSLRAEISELRAEFKGDFVKLSLVLIAGFLGVIATLIGVGLTS